MPSDVIYWTAWMIVIILYLAWPLTHLNAYTWNYDEGLYMQHPALANMGYQLYTDIYFNKPPLMVWILQLAFLIAGPTVVVARLVALGIKLLGLCALGAVTSALWQQRWAGLVAAALLMTLPEMPVRAHLVSNDLTSMSAILIGLGAALAFRQTKSHRTGSYIWWGLSSVACASALLIHPILLYMGLPLALILFLPGLGSHNITWRDMAVFIGVGMIIALLVLVFIDVHAFFTWAVQRNLSAVGANLQLASSTVNRELMYAYLVGNASGHWPWLGLAILGIVASFTQKGAWQRLAVPVAWFLITVIAFLKWSPLWEHYLIFLMFPLLILASSGMTICLGWLIESIVYGSPQPWYRWTLICLGLIGVLTLFIMRWGMEMPQPEGGPAWSEDQMAARAYIETHVPEGEFIATDDPFLAFAAGRLVPPPLTEATFRQIRMGYITKEDLIASVLRFRPPVVLFATGRFDEAHGFEHWVSSVAVERREFGALRAYRIALPEPTGSNAPLAYLDDAIILQGYEISSRVLQPGDTLKVRLLWHTVAPVDTNYIVFVHLLDAEGCLVTQHDGPPLGGAYPTGEWETGLLLPDDHTLKIPETISPGTYWLSTGMYSRPTLARLPSTKPEGTRWRDDRITLVTVRIDKRQEDENTNP